jgi:hypothetical protein
LRGEAKRAWWHKPNRTRGRNPFRQPKPIHRRVADSLVGPDGDQPGQRRRII